MARRIFRSPISRLACARICPWITAHGSLRRRCSIASGGRGALRRPTRDPGGPLICPLKTPPGPGNGRKWFARRAGRTGRGCTRQNIAHLSGGFPGRAHRPRALFAPGAKDRWSASIQGLTCDLIHRRDKPSGVFSWPTCSSVRSTPTGPGRLARPERKIGGQHLNNQVGAPSVDICRTVLGGPYGAPKGA